MRYAVYGSSKKKKKQALVYGTLSPSLSFRWTHCFSFFFSLLVAFSLIVFFSVGVYIIIIFAIDVLVYSVPLFSSLKCSFPPVLFITREGAAAKRSPPLLALYTPHFYSPDR